MPKKNGNDAGWNKTFVNVNLTNDDRQAIKAWSLTLEDLDNAFLKLVEEGHRVNVSYDSFNQCFSATLNQTDEKHRNAPLLLSGKGSTPLKALKQVMYIHWKLLDGDWVAYSQSHQRAEIDD